MKRPALDTFEHEALAELVLVGERKSLLTIAAPWGSSVVLTFESSNGWKFAVFDDSGWDYLEWIEAPDGRRWEFRDGWDDATQDESEILQDWNPPDDTLWTDAPVRS